MYQTEKGRIAKHIDFVIIDIICMELSFIFAYYIRHSTFKLLNVSSYRSAFIILIVANVISFYLFYGLRDVLKRSKQLEFYATLKQVIMVLIILVLYLFLTKTSEDISRNVIIIFSILYFISSFIIRLIYKSLLKSIIKNKTKRQFVVISEYNKIDKVLDKIYESVNDINIKGIVFLDNEHIASSDKYLYNSKKVESISFKIIKTEEVIKYLKSEYVDEVLVSVDDVDAYDLVKKISIMGMVIHIELDDIDKLVENDNVLQVDNVGELTVLTSSINTISALQLIAKRLMDIVFGVIGTIFTIILAIIIGPIIKFKSKGPIFFVQKRVGRNGKIFDMLKFRSMYLDADKDKKKLKNENEDDLMFKMKEDPRVIKGIGEFIRKTSIDEFPQFINVLKGDMSVVGTRPPTIDEWEKYDLHHRARLVIKPGITGLWQVSGRSNIKNFEDVVALDTKYIKTFSLWQDVAIIYKTILVVIKKEGAR